jgi:hypothetical protein
MKIKPKWPDFLIDTYFDVIKVNIYGRKMRRIMKLNQHFVVNITNGNEITKFYPYIDIRRVWLENGNTVVVVLRNGKQCVYMSHVAPLILQQVLYCIVWYVWGARSLCMFVFVCMHVFVNVFYV